MKRAVDIQTIPEVVAYWRECLGLLDKGYPDQQVAALMVNIVNNDQDEIWNSDPNSHPAYSLIFEMVASLELPESMTTQRSERWHCVRALVDVLGADQHDV
jgi:hypothetical protein